MDDTGCVAWKPLFIYDTEQGTMSDEFEATYVSCRWRADENDRAIIVCEDHKGIEVCVLGDLPADRLTEEVMYKFAGKWKADPRFGDQFQCESFIQLQPASKLGVTNYLAKHAKQVGPSIAGTLWDLYGCDAVKKLRMDPEACSIRIPGFTLSRAKTAAKSLEDIRELEDTRIELTALFDKKGFHNKLYDICIKKWGIAAPEVIRNDPFILLEHRLPSAGFRTCDNLYLSLGLPRKAMRRQVVCLWYVIVDEQTGAGGSTWFQQSFVCERLSQLVGGLEVDPNSVVQAAVDGRWVDVRTDSLDRVWLADLEKSRAEAQVAKEIKRISNVELATS